MADPLSSALSNPALLTQASKPEWRMSEAQTREEAEKLAKEFEAMFLQEMLQPIFDQIETDGPFGGGQAEAAFRPMLLENYAKSISDSGGIGISDSILTEILRMQGLE